MSTVFCATKEAAPIYSGKWTFTKCPADAAIGWSSGDTSIPSDMSRPFICIRFLLFRNCSQGNLLLCQYFPGCPVGGAIWRRLWQRACPSSTRDQEFGRPTICPRGPYWGWSFQHPQSVRIHCPCQESGAGGWWLHGTTPQECSFCINSCCWHTLWGTDMGVGYYRLLFCGSTESEWAFL